MQRFRFRCAPTLDGLRTYRMRGSRAEYAWTIRGVSSVEQLSTMTSSKSANVWARTDSTASFRKCP